MKGLLTVPAPTEAGAAGPGAGSDSPNRSRAGATAAACIVLGAGLAPLEDTPRDAAMLGLTLTWTHQLCITPPLLFDCAHRE